MKAPCTASIFFCTVVHYIQIKIEILSRIWIYFYINIYKVKLTLTFVLTYTILLGDESSPHCIHSILRCSALHLY